jgi:hypothetical protein
LVWEEDANQELEPSTEFLKTKRWNGSEENMTVPFIDSIRLFGLFNFIINTFFLLFMFMHNAIVNMFLLTKIKN